MSFILEDISQKCKNKKLSWVFLLSLRFLSGSTISKDTILLK